MLQRKTADIHKKKLSSKEHQEKSVPQGSILSVTLFSIKINNIVKCLTPLNRLYSLCRRLRHILSGHSYEHMLYSHLLIHAEIYIYILDTYRRNDNRRKNKGRRKTSLQIYLPLTLLQGFERVVQGLHVRGCWRPNINFIFWPPLLMTVTLCLSCSLDVQPEA